MAAAAVVVVVVVAAAVVSYIQESLLAMVVEDYSLVVTPACSTHFEFLAIF